MKYHISTTQRAGSTRHKQNGSYEYPFLAAAGKPLDDSLEHIPAQSEIELATGEYWIRGRSEGGAGLHPLPGWRISPGRSGQGDVIIRLMPEYHPENRLCGAFVCDYNRPADGFSIDGITFDLGADAAGKRALAAVALVGDGIAIRNCHAVNYGNGCEAGKGPESFIFAIGSGTKNAKQNTIESCSCLRPGPLKSANTSCFIVGGTAAEGQRWTVEKAVIANCKAESHRIGPEHFTTGATVSLCEEGSIANCHMDGIRCGVYQDSWSTGLARIFNNQIYEASAGFFLRFVPGQGGENVPLKRAEIIGNRVLLDARWGKVSGVCINNESSHEPIAEHVVLCRNEIIWAPNGKPGDGKIWGMGAKLGQIRRLVLADNLIELPGVIYGPWDIANCPSIVAAGNKPEFGEGE